MAQPMPDQKPAHPNPIRRFREVLRLDRWEFSKLLGVPYDTLRIWERRDAPAVPKPVNMRKLLDVVEKNGYPLTLVDISKYAKG